MIFHTVWFRVRVSGPCEVCGRPMFEDCKGRRQPRSDRRKCSPACRAKACRDARRGKGDVP